MERRMKKFGFVTLSLAFLGLLLPPAVAQSADAASTSAADAPSKKLESLFADAEIPFTKTKSGLYVAVITVRDESDRFSASVDTLGNDPNDSAFQLVTIYFPLGELPKGEQMSSALAKQIIQWNTNLSVGKIVLLDSDFYFTSTLWLDHADANALAREVIIAHVDAKGLRKELAPYLNQQ